MKRKKKHEFLSFEELARLINGYLIDDGLQLNFRGYRAVITRYFRLQDHDVQEIHELMIDCNLWHNYFSDIEALMSLKKEEWTLEVDWHTAHELRAEPSESLENKIQFAKLRVMHYGMFLKHVHIQTKFFARASEKCQRAYKKTFGRMARAT